MIIEPLLKKKKKKKLRKLIALVTGISEATIGILFKHKRLNFHLFLIYKA